MKIAKIEFMGATGPTRSVTEDSETIRYTFANGVVRTFDPSDLDTGTMRLAALHGLKQKISDGYAECGGDAAMAEGMADAMWERLLRGEWTLKGEGVGSGATDLATALAEHTGKPLAEVIAKLQEKTKEERAALRKHAALAPILARITAERAEAKLAKAQAAAAQAPELDF